MPIVYGKTSNQRIKKVIYGKSSANQSIRRVYYGKGGVNQMIWSRFPAQMSGQATGYYYDKLHDEDDHGYNRREYREAHIVVNSSGILFNLNPRVYFDYSGSNLRMWAKSYAKVKFSEPLNVFTGEQVAFFTNISAAIDAYSSDDECYHKIIAELADGSELMLLDLATYVGKTLPFDQSISAQNVNILAPRDLSIMAIKSVVAAEAQTKYNENSDNIANATITSIGGENIIGKTVSPITEDYNWDDEDGPNA